MTQRNGRPGDTPSEQPLDHTTTGFPDPAAQRPTAAEETSQLPVVPEDAESGTAQDPAPAETQPPRRERRRSPGATGSFAGSTWVAMIVGLVLLILLIVFIMQNQQQVELNLFAWTFQFPAGIGYLITAIAGGLIIALVGMVRMLELRRQVRKLRKQLR